MSGWCETQYMVKSDTQITKKKEGCQASSHLPNIPYTQYHLRPSHQTPLFRFVTVCVAPPLLISFAPYTTCRHHTRLHFSDKLPSGVMISAFLSSFIPVSHPTLTPGCPTHDIYCTGCVVLHFQVFPPSPFIHY